MYTFEIKNEIGMFYMFAKNKVLVQFSVGIKNKFIVVAQIW